jgi:DNA-directed RNA polymerase specialized sigma24 family protein
MPVSRVALVEVEVTNPGQVRRRPPRRAGRKKCVVSKATASADAAPTCTHNYHTAKFCQGRIGPPTPPDRSGRCAFDGDRCAEHRISRADLHRVIVAKQAALVRTARGIALATPQLAGDIANDAIARLLDLFEKGRRVGDDEEGVARYLITIAVNVAHEVYRDARRLVPIDLDAPAADGLHGDARADDPDRIRCGMALREVLGAASPSDRQRILEAAEFVEDEPLPLDPRLRMFESWRRRKQLERARPRLQAQLGRHGVTRGDYFGPKRPAHRRGGRGRDSGHSE